MNDIRRELMQVFESGIEGDNITKIEAIIERAVQAEREACAKLAEHDPNNLRWTAARDIRARSQDQRSPEGK
jgi:hypothetical protein